MPPTPRVTVPCRAGIALAIALLVAAPASAGPAEDLTAFLGGRSGKLVAHDQADGDKIYVFDLDDGSLVKLSDEIACTQPLLSPDGTRVVYGRAKQVFIRTIGGGAATLVADGYDGHFWIDGAGDEWIYYTTLGTNPADTKRKLYWPTAQGITTRRVRLRDQQDEWVLDWKGNGGPSKDGSRVGAGYSSMIIFEVPSGVEHVVNGGTQGCNPSMSPDNRYLLMHLELPHDTFCYRNQSDQRVWYVTKPAGTVEWQTPEWSTDADFATATAQESSGNYSVYAVKLSTKEILRVLDARTGASNWSEPHLWVRAAPACTNGQTRPCGSSVGTCTQGTETCQNGGWGSCTGGVQATTEKCNGQDDDCDGSTDETWPALGSSCSVGVGACRRTGTMGCKPDGSGVVCSAVAGPPQQEACEGQIDEDCDGTVDNGCACTDSAPRACYAGPAGTDGVGPCHGGTQTCAAGSWGACSEQTLPAAEVCDDGIDNDCDGLTDLADTDDCAAPPDGGNDDGGVAPDPDGGADVPDAGLPGGDGGTGRWELTGVYGCSLRAGGAAAPLSAGLLTLALAALCALGRRRRR